MTESHKTICSRGGKKTLEKFGNAHFVTLAKKAAEVRMKKYGTEYYKELSRKGVEARKLKKQQSRTIAEKVIDAITAI